MLSIKTVIAIKCKTSFPIKKQEAVQEVKRQNYLLQFNFWFVMSFNFLTREVLQPEKKKTDK